MGRKRGKEEKGEKRKSIMEEIIHEIKRHIS